MRREFKVEAERRCPRASYQKHSALLLKHVDSTSVCGKGHPVIWIEFTPNGEGKGFGIRKRNRRGVGSREFTSQRLKKVW